MKKIIKGLLNTFFAFIIVTFLILILCFASGIKPYIVQSGSMEPSIKTGSFAFVNIKSDYEDIKIGDVIAYETSMGSLVTHRVINMEDGFLETKGDNNEVSDGFSVNEDNFYGKTLLSIPYLGYLFAWIQTKRGMILTGTIVCAAFILEYALSDDEKEDKGNDEQKSNKDSV